ncbi:MAG: S41 family peptidase [Clostridia bacterium]|nr:S41 family peptidase [Clostridia bacterium]
MGKFIDKYFKTIIVLLVTAAIFTCIGALIGKKLASSEPTLPKQTAEKIEQNEKIRDAALSKADEVFYLVDNYFVGDIDKTFMGDAIAAGIIAGTGDRWSYYISAADYAEYMEGMNNSYVGVGITIRLEHDDDPGYTVISVTKGSPAEKAGVHAGDLFIKVDGEDVLPLGMDATKNRVRGEVGTEVTLTFLRDGEELTLTMKRASVAVENVTYQLLADTVGYIKIDNFDTNACKDTIAAIEAVREAGATSLLFDVRYNPGGMKSELVALLDYLLPEGKLFISEDYEGKQSIDYSDEKCIDLPMAVLVNEDSYSAAEFFAAALQEYGVAKIYGTQTCGKGYFQTTFQLSDGSAVAVSIGKYRTPNGVSLAEVGGLVPDKIVEVDEQTYYSIYYDLIAPEDDTQIAAAISGLKQ